MRVSCSPYTLIGKPPYKDRKGALLRIEYRDGKVGYCDCHPWPECGDETLFTQIEMLKNGLTTNLTKCSLKFAKLDAEARALKKNLFEGLTIPPSHWLLKSMDEPIPEGFTTVKLKVKKDDNLTNFLENLPPGIKVRLDFNNAHTFESFSKCVFNNTIDFIEDPYPYEKESWEKSPVPLATDFQKERGPISILKPARDNYEEFLHCDRIIVTSYLDHPIGQLSAAYVAALLKKKRPEKIDVCGLLSHHVYEENPFSKRLNFQHPNSLGFDDLLENSPWEVINDRLAD